MSTLKKDLFDQPVSPVGGDQSKLIDQNRLVDQNRLIQNYLREQPRSGSATDQSDLSERPNDSDATNQSNLLVQSNNGSATNQNGQCEQPCNGGGINRVEKICEFFHQYIESNYPKYHDKTMNLINLLIQICVVGLSM